MSVPLGGFPAAAVVIGASTGGPPVVESILRALPKDFPAPIAIAQHMAPGFVERWAERLDPLSWLRVKTAEDGEPFERGTVYIAQTGYHLILAGSASRPRLQLEQGLVDSLNVPAVDKLFASAATVFVSRALGVLLTGLGSDGAEGMLALRRVGSYTLIQRPDTSVASSMPSSAAALGAAVEEVAATDLPRVIIERARGSF